MHVAIAMQARDVLIPGLEKLGFTTITFEDYHLFREGKLNLPKKPIIVTFDDSYNFV